MAYVNFKKGTSADYQQNQAQYSEYIYMCTDTRDLYVYGVLQQGITDEVYQKLVNFDGSVLEVINAQKNIANGIAGLDENGKIDPSLVDGVVGHVLGLEQFVTENPSPVEDGKYYYNSTSKKILEGEDGAWTETDPQAQVLYNRRGEDENGHTNTLYRWDGSEMVPVSDPIAIGEVTGTAYDGAKGKANRDALNAMSAKVITGFGVVTPNGTQITIAFTDANKSSDNNQYSAGTGGNIIIPAATDTAAGLMSAEDKSKFDALMAGYDPEDPDPITIPELKQEVENITTNVTNITNNMGDVTDLTTEAKTVVEAINEHETQINDLQSDLEALDAAAVKKIQVGTGAAQTPAEGLVVIANATNAADGAMSKEDKTKLDTILNTGNGNKYLGDDLQYHDMPKTYIVLDLATDLANGNGNTTQPVFQSISDSITNGMPVFIKMPNSFTFAATAINAGTAVYLDVVMADMDAAEGAYKAEAVRYSVAADTYAVTTVEKASPTLVSNGDGTQFLTNDGTYKALEVNDIKLSESYTPSELVNEALAPAPGDNLDTAIGKLHKAIWDNEEVTAQALTNMQTTIGLENPNQTLPDLSGTNYLGEASTIVACLQALDTALKTVADQADQITDLESRVAALEQALTLKTV